MQTLDTRFAGCWVRSLLGGAVWIAGVLTTLPNPSDTAWGQALLLLVPFVLLPIGFDLATRRDAAGLPDRIGRAVTAFQAPAALLLGVAYFLPQGLLAGGLALPWFMTTALIALCGLKRIKSRGLGPPDEVCLDAALIFVVVGGAWAASDRLGFRPLDFESSIVLLTAIHFHYAGFILPIVTGLAIRHTRGRMANLAGIGVIAAVPLVAVGITATQLQLGPQIECLAAWFMAMSGGLAAWLHLRLAAKPFWPSLVRCLWAISGLSLFGCMILAAMYGARFYAPVAWLDIPRMRALHGSANAIGFALAGLLAWSLAKKHFHRVGNSDPAPPGGEKQLL